MPSLTRSAAARNPPNPPVDDTNPRAGLPKRQPKRKPAARKRKTKAPLSAGSEDAAASAIEVDNITESATPRSTDLPRAARVQIPPPSPPSRPPRKITTTYSRNPDASGTNRPVPRLPAQRSNDAGVDGDSAFISSRVKWGCDDRGIHPTPVPSSSLDMEIHPDDYSLSLLEKEQNLCSDDINAGEGEDQHESDDEGESQDRATPLYFPPSPASSHARGTQSPDGSQSPQVPFISSPSGSDYSEKARKHEQMRAQRVRLRGCHAVTPTQEEQDDEDDRMLQEQSPISSWFTAKQKGKGKVHHQPLEHHSNNNDEDEGSASEQNPGEMRAFKSGPVRATAKAQLMEARRIYHETVARIAHEEGKPVELLFRIVGETVGKPRRINIWNAFQSWYPEHGEIRREDNSTQLQFNFSPIFS